MSKNVKLLLILVTIGISMFGLSYAFVPLYRMFCEFVGIPVPQVSVGKAGTPKPVDTETSDRVVTVRFMGNTANQVPVDLKPVMKSIKVRIGEPVLTAYRAQSHSDDVIDGVAVHTIIGMGTAAQGDVSEHIDLQQCFCFEQQTYPANEEVMLPLSFHVADTLPEDTHTIVFGYTLYEDE